MYAPANPEVLVRISKLPQEILDKQTEVKIVEASNSAQTVVSIPRYDKFSKIMPELLEGGVEVFDISGNDDLLVTAVGTGQLTEMPGEILFETPIYSDSNKKRFAIAVKVMDLQETFQKLKSQGFTIEHLFDY